MSILPAIGSLIHRASQPSRSSKSAAAQSSSLPFQSPGNAKRPPNKINSSLMKANTCWVPGVNNPHVYGRWAFAEFTEVYQMESDFEAKVEGEFNKMIEERVKREE
jgi:hypothetical protein